MKTFLYRQRKAARKAIEKLPDLRKLPYAVQAENGEVFNLSDIAEYKLMVDHWSAKVSMVASDKEGNQIKVQIPDLAYFMREAHSSMEGTEERDNSVR